MKRTPYAYDNSNVFQDRREKAKAFWGLDFHFYAKGIFCNSPAFNAGNKGKRSVQRAEGTIRDHIFYYHKVREGSQRVSNHRVHRGKSFSGFWSCFELQSLSFSQMFIKSAEKKLKLFARVMGKVDLRESATFSLGIYGKYRICGFCGLDIDSKP